MGKPDDLHHYLPQFYLRTFRVDGAKEMFEYDKETGKVAAKRIKECGSKPGNHSFRRKDGTIDCDTVERMLGADFETKMAPLYKRIRLRTELTPEEMGTFILFTASMFGRSPIAFRNAKAMFDGIFQRMFENSVAFDREFVQRCVARGVPLEALEAAKIEPEQGATMLAALDGFIGASAQIFAPMEWHFFHAPEESLFCTGDNAVFHCAPDASPGPFGARPGLGHPSTEVTFPLSRRICAFGVWKPWRSLHSEASAEMVTEINIRTIRASLRYVYSGMRSDAVLDLVKRTKGSAPQIFVS